MGERVLRIFTFRPLHGAFDEVVRRELMPDLKRKPGNLDAYSARQGPDDVGQRVIATVWRTRSAMVEAVGEGLGSFRPEYFPEVTDRRLAVVPVRAGRRYLETVRPRILRILRGRVRPGELAAYAEDVDQGAEHDASRDDGPVAVYMGPAVEDGPDAFVTLSAWREWSHIEIATGGDVDRTRATRHPERLLAWDVAHFEVVPDG
jgi:hypothetical protein